MASPTPSKPDADGRAFYENDVDFDVLAAHDSDFAAICKVSKHKRWIDFQDPKVVKCALLPSLTQNSTPITNNSIDSSPRVSLNATSI